MTIAPAPAPTPSFPRKRESSTQPHASIAELHVLVGKLREFVVRDERIVECPQCEDVFSMPGFDNETIREAIAELEARITELATPLAASEAERLRAENSDLRTSVIAFGAPWAVEYARAHGLPPHHLHPVHYDILRNAGARMDDFVRPEAFPSTNSAVACHGR